MGKQEQADVFSKRWVMDLEQVAAVRASANCVFTTVT